MRRDLLPFWGNKPIATITKRDIIERIEAIVDRGAPSQAHMALSNARRIFNWAIERDIVSINPIAGLRPKNLIGEKTVRQRVLTDAEIAAFWHGCEKLPYPHRQMFRMLLLTGQRRTEVASASWREFDFEARLWTIPEERFKSGSVHQVPLSDMALEVLATCPRFAGGDFVFTAKNGRTPAAQIDHMKYHLDAIMKSELSEPPPRWTLHDLRRTVRTRLSGLRVPEPVAEMVIGHGKKGLGPDLRSTRICDEMREAMDAWAFALRAIVEPPPRNVVAMRLHP